MNTNIRNVGGAIGAGVATSLVVSTLLADGTPAEHGFILAFVISAVAMLVAAGATLLIPRHVESVDSADASADADSDADPAATHTDPATTGGPSLLVVD